MPSWLKPPVFENEDKTHQAFLLHIILWTLVVIPLPYVTITVLISPDQLGRAVAQALFGEIANFSLLILLRRGRVNLACWLQVLMFAVFFAATAATGAGVRSEAYLLGNALVIMNAGVLLGGRGAMVMVVLVVLAGAVLTYREQTGAFTPDLKSSALLTWVASSVLFPVSAVLQYLAARTLHRAVHRARTSEARFRALVEEAPMGLLILNASGAIELANPVACSILGYSIAELQKISPFTLLPPEDRERFAGRLQDVRSGEVTREERTLLHQTGRRVEVAGTFHRMPDQRFQYVFEDITTRKQAEDAIRQYTSILHHMQIGMYVIRADDVNDDTSLRVMAVNPAAERFSEKSAAELVGQRMDDVFLTLRAKGFSARYLQVMKTGQPVELEDYYYEPNGKLREAYAVKVFPLAADTVGVLAESVLGYKRLNAELEQRVAERTAQLQAANKDLEAFSYSVSHDLRTPLRAMDGYSRAVLEDYGDRLDDAGRHALTRILESVKRMGHLIDDLLQFSRLGRKTLDVQALSAEDMELLVKGVVEELRAAHRGRAIDVALGPLAAARADLILLQQVWANLVGNAFKYTQKRAAARIEIGSVASAEGPVYFVKDNGAGFDMRYTNKLFTVFQRLHRTEEFEGTGVGLAIVHRIVQRHGGRVWAEAEVDNGAAFYFTLPPAPEETTHGR